MINQLMRTLIRVGWPLLIVNATSAYATRPSPDGEPPLEVIDVHTHVFNCRDLPLRGILMAKHVPLPAAAALEAALIAWTPSESADDNLPNTPQHLISGVRRNPDSGAPFSQPRRVLSMSQQREIANYVGEVSPPAAARAMLSEIALESTDLNLVAKALQKAGFPPEESPASAAKIQTASSPEVMAGFIRFIRVMTQSHAAIAETLRHEVYPETDVFVDHMMDMEAAYASPPSVPFTEQLTMMKHLDSQQRGALLHFMAFDPFRQDNALTMVEEGMRTGAVGVKFYPPSGYRPAGNDIPRKPFPWPWNLSSRARWESRYHGMSDDDLNKVCEQFFLEAVSNDWPVFAHCTPHGFEGEPGYGLNADPKYWAKLLADPRFSKLRLCLGHAGGDAYWFAGDKAKEDKTFGAEVVKLCLAYPNVYCEVGYLERILAANDRALFKKRLAGLLDQDAADGKKFGDKIMYGTDWHMIEKEPHREDYLNAFDQLLSDIDGGKWRRRFFAGNAVAYLNLGKLAEDSRFTEYRNAWRKDVDDSKEVRR